MIQRSTTFSLWLKSGLIKRQINLQANTFYFLDFGLNIILSQTIRKWKGMEKSLQKSSPEGELSTLYIRLLYRNEVF